jgi:hypothetical protein
LECKAHQVVALEQSLGVEDTSGQIRNIDTSERVGLTGVATNCDQVRMVLNIYEGVAVEGKESVVVVKRAAVPLPCMSVRRTIERDHQ